MIPDELKRMRPLQGRERLGATRNSDYMGAEDIEPGTEPVLTIAAIYNGQITLARGKEVHDVVAFKEESVKGSIVQVRPLVLNSTNRKTLKRIYKVLTAENLVGKQVQLYLEHNVRDPSTGDRVDGIRIRPKVPETKAPEPIICEDCGKPVTGVGDYTAEYVAKVNKARYGRTLCAECSKKAKVAEETTTEEKE